MDKLLIFTNYTSGILLSQIEDKSEWRASYPVGSRPIVLCVNNLNGDTLLKPVNNIFDEGIYLVYDEIDKCLLEKMFSECEQKNDRICVLIHRSKGKYKDLGYFDQWKNIYPLQGMHIDIDSKEYLYKPIFDIIIDTKVKNKLNRIINTFFLPEVIQNFLSNCLVPNKNLRNTTSFHFLSNGGFENALGSFLDKYESSNTPEDYKEDYTKLKQSLLMRTQDINSL